MPQRFCVTFALVVMLSPFVVAQDRPRLTSEIIDGAEMFSNEAIRSAKEAMAKVERSYNVALTVETVGSLRGQTIDEVAVRRAEQLEHQGIFVLIAEKEHKIEVLASPRALREKLGQDRLNVIRDAITEEFRNKRIDDGLSKGIQAAQSTLATLQPATREGASAPPASPLVLRQQVRLTLAGARKALAASEAKATQEGLKMNITVVDDGGHLLAFARMDGAEPASVATSTSKAVSAATYRVATGPIPGSNKGMMPQSAPDVLRNVSVQSLEMASGGKITTLLGGVPIIVDGQVIGAIGVAGGSGEQDAEVAQAGVTAFLSALKEAATPEDSKPKVVEGEPAIR